MSFVCFLTRGLARIHNSLAFGCAVMLCLFACTVAVVSSLFCALVSVKTDLDRTRFRS